jgi:hypothetical protein
MAPSSLDMNALSSAVCKGLIEGNAPLVAAIVSGRNANHDVREHLQINTDKIYSLDTEVKLLKGVILSLNGTGDGSTGSVPRLESGMSALRADVSGLRSDVTSMKAAVDKLTAGQAEQKSWTDGWKGIGVAVALIGTCFTVIGGIITALVWLFQHGVK